MCPFSLAHPLTHPSSHNSCRGDIRFPRRSAIEALAPNLAEDAHKFYRALHGILGPTIPGMIK